MEGGEAEGREVGTRTNNDDYNLTTEPTAPHLHMYVHRQICRECAGPRRLRTPASDLAREEGKTEAVVDVACASLERAIPARG